MPKYKFKTNEDDMVYKPDKATFSYYQICSMKNPISNKYAVRKVIFNELGTILEVMENEYKKKPLDKFINGARRSQQHKFKIYATHDIKLIGLPDGGTILGAQSELLN
jgi:hypothetical protein